MFIVVVRQHFAGSWLVTREPGKASVFQRDARVFASTTLEQAGQRRTMGYFIHRKFELPEVQEELSKYGFENGNYSKLIVACGWTPEAKEVADETGDPESKSKKHARYVPFWA